MLVILDLLLALGACLRLTRFIVADDVPGTWFIKDPLHTASARWSKKHEYVHTPQAKIGKSTLTLPSVTVTPEAKWDRYLDGLSCPYCVSVWMAGLTALTLFLAGGPGDAADWWRYPAGFLTLAWLTGHIAARVGDTED